eukprot:3870872-Alexandrium_andersonii.AAC.1
MMRQAAAARRQASSRSTCSNEPCARRLAPASRLPRSSPRMTNGSLPTKWPKWMSAICWARPSHVVWKAASPA